MSALLQKRTLAETFLQIRFSAICAAANRDLTRSSRRLPFAWPQQEEQQRPARHFIRVPEFEGQRVFHVFVLVGEIGVEEPQPVTPARHRGKREHHHVMMGIGDQQKRSLACTLAYSAYLRSPVEEQSEAFRRRLRPTRFRHLLVCRSEPGAVLYP